MRSSSAPIVFDCQGEQLCGILHVPMATPARIGVLVVVGGPQYRAGSHRQFTLMARALADAGIAVMRFDYRGMGDSDGAVRSFEEIDDDIAAAIDTFIQRVPGLSRVVLWGLCDGASAALMYSSRDTRVAGLILANPWVRTQAGEARTYLRHYYVTRLLQKSFWSKLLGGKFDPLRSVRELAATLTKARQASTPAQAQRTSFLDRMLRSCDAFRGDILLLISEKDLTAREFVDLCRQSKYWQRAFGRAGVETVTLAGADHTFSSGRDLDTATAACARWLQALEARL